MRSHLAFLLAVFSGASASLLQGTLLNRAVGQSVSFEAPVFVRGFLQLDGLTIAEVMSGKETDDPPPRLKGRLTWDSQTGLFKISNLNPEDRGDYKVENFGGEVPVMVTFTLEVYDPVFLPQVRVTWVGGGTCFLECSVKNGREVTLLLKSRGKTLSHTVDPDLNVPLILHRVTEELSESYSCVASNPASNKSVTAHPDQYCAGPQKVELTEGDSFSFQAPVRQEGSLTHRDLGRIAQVSAGKMSPVRVESFRDRVTWHRTTGLFSISKLETGDSGEYTVEVKDEGRIKFLLSIQKGLNTTTVILCVMSVSLFLNAVMIIVLVYYKRKLKVEVARRREAEETFFDETVKL